MIRTAGVGDIVPLHELIERAYRGDGARVGWSHEADLVGGQRTDRETLLTTLADDDQRILVAEDEGVIIGCVAVQRCAPGACYLGLLTVEPELQSGGLGRRLIAAAEACAREFGAARMEMTVVMQRRELVEYYQRRGYTLTGERRPFPYSDERFGQPKVDGLEFVVLERALD